MPIAQSIPWREAVVAVGRGLCFIRETTPNAGEGVEACQRETGNTPPDYWCASFVVKVMVMVFGRHASPVPITASCDSFLSAAMTRGALVARPELQALAATEAGRAKARGWVFLSLASPTDATHTGIVSRVNSDGSFETIEGNAADPMNAASTNGNGAYFGRIRGGATDAREYAFINLEAM